LCLIGLHSLGTVMVNTLVYYLFMAFDYSEVLCYFLPLNSFGDRNRYTYRIFSTFITFMNSSLGTVMATNSDPLSSHVIC